MKFHVEHTDTFGGEANYCWVTRKTIEVPDNATDTLIVRRAKAALGLTGVPCRRSDYGEDIRLDLVGACQVVFISPVY